MRIYLVILCLAVVSTTGFAEKNADVKPILTTPASLSTQDTFDRTELGESWSSAKGEWKIVDGELIGKELKADKHAAVASFNHRNTDSVVKLSFKLTGTDGFAFSLNRKGGHLFRVSVRTDQVTINTDKDKKDPKSKSERLGSAKGDFAENQWHTLLIEMKGDKVAVSADNGVSVQGKHPSLATAKPGYRFVMRGESLVIDDIHVWDLAN